MKSLRILIAKRADGSVLFQYERDNGSIAAQRRHGADAQFFALHDLTHYVVETTLGHRRGFYGLLAEGWELTDFGSPWPRGPLPTDADPAEVIVGFLDAERSGNVEWTAADFNEQLAAFFLARGITGPPVLEPEVLIHLRERMRDLHRRWQELPIGGRIELRFNAD